MAVGRLFSVVMLIFIIDIALFVVTDEGSISAVFKTVAGVLGHPTYYGTPSDPTWVSNSTDTANTGATTWHLPKFASWTLFYWVVAAITAAIVLAGNRVQIGAFVLQPSYNVPYAGLAGMIWVFCQPTLQVLGRLISSNSRFCLSDAITPCATSWLFAIIIIGPILLYLSWTAVEYSRGRD
jgi:hypothetical protein